MRFSCPKCGKVIDVDAQGVDDSFACPHCKANLRYSVEAVHPGRIIAGFELQELLGVGGMGEVWLAYQQSMDRQVAIKILSPYLSKDKSFVENFLEEVKLAAKLEHPNIVSAFDAGVDDGIYYLAMSYVPGETFAVRVGREKMLPEKEVMKIALHIAKALDYAWERFKIVHRDVNPANIMLTPEGNIKLMDMGISKNMDEDNGEVEESLLGTPNYISPEQIRGDSPLDFRSDIYSLGSTLYHLATGIVPFDSEDNYEILRRQLEEDLPLASETNPKISSECSKLIAEMMSKDKEQRPKSWQAVIDRVEQISSWSTVSGAGTAVKDAHHKQVTVSREHLKKLHEDHVRQVERSGRRSALPMLFILLALVALSAFLALRVLEQKEGNIDNRSFEGQSFDPKAESPKGGVAEDVAEVEDPGNIEATKQSRMERIERAWNRAVILERENPESYLAIVREYSRVRDMARGTVFQARAEKKLEEFERRHRAKIVMNELGMLAKRHVASGDYRAAASVYSEYSGAGQEETRGLRMRIADRLLSMAEAEPQISQGTEDQEESEDSATEDFMTDIASDLCQAKLNEVLMKCNAFEQRPIEEPSKSISRQIKAYVEDILRSEQKLREALMSGDIKSVTMLVNGERRTVGVKTDGEELLAEVRQGRGLAHFPFSLRQIPIEERYRILDGRIDAVPREIYIGIYYFNKGELEEARQHFENSGELSPYLLRHLADFRKGMQEKKVADSIAMLLSASGLIERGEEIDWQKIAEQDRLRRISRQDAESLLKGLSSLREGAADSDYMRKNGEQIAEFCKLIESTDFRDSSESLFGKAIGTDLSAGLELEKQIVRARSSRGIPLRCNPKGRGLGVIPELAGEKLNSNMILIIQSGDYSNREISLSGKNNITIKAEEDVENCILNILDCRDVNIQGVGIGVLKIRGSQYTVVDSRISDFRSYGSNGLVHNSRLGNALCSGAVVYDHCLITSLAPLDTDKINLRNSILYGYVGGSGAEMEYVPCFRWLNGHDAVVTLQNSLVFTKGVIGVVNEISRHFEVRRYWDRNVEDRKFYNIANIKDRVRLENSFMRDPEFANPGKHDYRLKYNSPARKGSISGKNDIGPSPDLKPFPL